MLRQFVGASLALLLGFSAAVADDVRGTVKSADPAKNTLTLTVGTQTVKYAVAPGASIHSAGQAAGKKKKAMEKLTPVPNGLGGLAIGTNVTAEVGKVSGKDTVLSVKTTGSTGKAVVKNKKKNKSAKKLIKKANKNKSAKKLKKAAKKAKIAKN